MFSIITLTFSPCIDKSTSVASLIPEKKLVCTQPRLEPGGGGINVARAIKRLGGDALAIFPSGGYTGKYFNHLMKKENIPVVIIETVNETRENIIVLDESTNSQYRFGMPGTPLQDKEWQQCLEAIDKMDNAKFIVASGSLPPGVPGNIFARLAHTARQKKIKLVVDTSGKALQAAVKEGVYLIKPNMGELSLLAGDKNLTGDTAGAAARKIIANGGCEVIVVSMGERGALLVTKEEEFSVSTPPVKRRSTVGAGDSMVGGIVFSLTNGKSIRESVIYGVACGTAATMNPGTELCHKTDADKLYALLVKGETY